MSTSHALTRSGRRGRPGEPTTRRTSDDVVGRCERLLARSALLDTTGIDWHRIGVVELSQPVLDCLVYMRDVEGFTNRRLSGLAGHPATLGDPLIGRFLPLWQQEEGAHARALDRYLRTYAKARAVTVPEMQAPPPVDERADRWLVALTRPIGHVVTAAHMTWGAANELLTMTGYRLLAARCADPVLAELLGRIAAQESRHYAFYRLQAERRLARSQLARVVLRRLMRDAWTPVGVGEGYKAPSELDRLLEFLGGDERGAAAVVAMDGAFARLPGLGHMRIYERAVGVSRRRTHAENGDDADPARSAAGAPVTRR